MSEKIGASVIAAPWDDLRLFLAVARAGGLSSAARSTGRSPATLGRRMLALEQALGRDLFRRHDRGYDLTAEGQSLLTDLAEIDSRILRATAPTIAGDLPRVKLSAGTWTTLALTGALSDLLGTPPDIRLQILPSEARLDLTHREAAIGIRNARPTETGLAGRKLSRVDFAPYGHPDGPDLWIRVTAQTPSARWVQEQTQLPAACEVSTPRSSLDLALAGQGIALLPTFIGDGLSNLARRGDIVPELSHDRWLVTHDEDRHLPHIRRAIDRVIKVLDRLPSGRQRTT